MILKAAAESRPEVGSSKNNIFGFDIISIPIETLLFYPPEIPFYKGFPILTSFLK